MALFDDRAESVLSAHIAYLRALLPASGGSIAESDGVLIYRSTHPLPFLINGAARTDFDVPPSRVLELARGSFPDRGFEVLCLQGRDDDLHAAAVEIGLRAGDPDPLQYLHGPPLPGPVDRSSVRFEAVSDTGDIDAVIAINRDASSVYRFPDGVFESLFATPATVLAPEIHAVVAYEQDAAVATAQIFMHGDTAYVGWVAVVRSAMGRGLGWQVTEEVVREGINRGAKAAVLMASPMGAGLYRKMGFEDVGFLTNAYFRHEAGA